MATGNELTAQECSALAHHEATIERGLETFHEVGAALLEIQDGRLYRETHAAFEDYCRERWQMSRRRARPGQHLEDSYDNGCETKRQAPT